VRFAIGLPNVGAYGDPGLLVELGGMAEQSGWDGVFIWDHVAYREPGWPVADPQVAVAALAATTKHVRLGVLMVALPRRRPWKVARELASLDPLLAQRRGGASRPLSRLSGRLKLVLADARCGRISIAGAYRSETT
jgi:Luciferase-like monooxygenase